MTLFEWHSYLTTSWSKSRYELNDRVKQNRGLGWVIQRYWRTSLGLHKPSFFLCAFWWLLLCVALLFFAITAIKIYRKADCLYPRRVLKLLFNNVSFGIKPCMHTNWFGAYWLHIIFCSLVFDLSYLFSYDLFSQCHGFKIDSEDKTWYYVLICIWHKQLCYWIELNLCFSTFLFLFLLYKVHSCVSSTICLLLECGEEPLVLCGRSRRGEDER